MPKRKAPVRACEANKSSDPATDGFTLMEMLMVVMIIAVLSTVLAVSLGGRTDRYSLRIAAKDISSALQYAGRQSRMAGRAHRLMFDEGFQSFIVEQTASELGEDFLPVEGSAGRKRTLPPGVWVEAVMVSGVSADPIPHALDFFCATNADGTGFSGSIRLRNRQGEAMDVETTGRASEVLVKEPEK